MNRAFAVSAVLLVSATLASCETRPEAPSDPGVCWQAVMKEGEEPRFNKVADNQPSIESCAARLEEVRLRFAQLTSVKRNVTGAYQGQWLFVTGEAIRTAQNYDGVSFVLLVRAPDGRLVAPGAVAQPAYGSEGPAPVAPATAPAP